MSTDESVKGIKALADSGELSRGVAREAIAHPVAAETLIRVDRVEKETSRQSAALFGDVHLDPPGNTPGLLRDVRMLQIAVFQAKWSILGGLAVCTTILTILGLVIAWLGLPSHH